MYANKIRDRTLEFLPARAAFPADGYVRSNLAGVRGGQLPINVQQ